LHLLAGEVAVSQTFPPLCAAARMRQRGISSGTEGRVGSSASRTSGYLERSSQCPWSFSQRSQRVLAICPCTLEVWVGTRAPGLRQWWRPEELNSDLHRIFRPGREALPAGSALLGAKAMTTCVADIVNMVQPDPTAVRRRRWFQRRPVRVTIVVVAILLVAVVGYLRAYGRLVHDYDSGPLTGGSSTKTSFPVEIGQPFTYGVIVVSNQSRSTARLTDLRVKPALPAGMEIVALQVVGPNRTTIGIGTDDRYPPPELVGHLRPFKGTRVPPEDSPGGKGGVEVIFGFKINRAGMFGFEKVEIDYKIGTKPYTLVLEDGFVGCAPYADYKDTCSIETFFGSES
jgi:hypothetical protein